MAAFLFVSGPFLCLVLLDPVLRSVSKSWFIFLNSVFPPHGNIAVNLGYVM